jgi:hypothetical protein
MSRDRLQNSTCMVAGLQVESEGAQLFIPSSCATANDADRLIWKGEHTRVWSPGAAVHNPPIHQIQGCCSSFDPLTALAQRVVMQPHKPAHCTPIFFFMLVPCDFFPIE